MLYSFRLPFHFDFTYISNLPNSITMCIRVFFFSACNTISLLYSLITSFYYYCYSYVLFSSFFLLLSTCTHIKILFQKQIHWSKMLKTRRWTMHSIIPHLKVHFWKYSTIVFFFTFCVEWYGHSIIIYHLPCPIRRSIIRNYVFLLVSFCSTLLWIQNVYIVDVIFLRLCFIWFDFLFFSFLFLAVLRWCGF